MPRSDRFVGRLGGEPGLLAVHLGRGVQFSIRCADPREQGIHEIDRGEPTSPDLGRQDVGRPQGRIGVERRHGFLAGGSHARPHVRLSTGRPVSQYAGNEGCAGLAGAEPHA